MFPFYIYTRYGIIIVATMAMMTISTTIDTILLVLLLLKFILLPSLIIFSLLLLLILINFYVNSNVFLYILYSLQYFCKKHSPHFGLLAVQMERPNVIICILYRIQWSFGSAFIKSCSIFSGSSFSVSPRRFEIRLTCVSTTTLGSW